MLKRCQVLLSDWMVDYIKFVAEKFDVSFSEVVRSGLCVYFAQTISNMYPKVEFGLEERKRIKAIEKISSEGKGESVEELHNMISRIYFEARKAIEFRLIQEKKKGKKNKKSRTA